MPGDLGKGTEVLSLRMQGGANSQVTGVQGQPYSPRSGLALACRKTSLASMKTFGGEGIEARHQQHLL